MPNPDFEAPVGWLLHPDEPQLRGNARWFGGVPVIPSPNIGVPVGYEMCFFDDVVNESYALYLDRSGHWVRNVGEVTTGVRAWCRPVPKPLVKKPNYGNIRALVYASVLPGLQEVAHSCGYALTIHGSMARDFDMVAVAWTEEAVPAAELIERIRVLVATEGSDAGVHGPELRAHGRQAWIIALSCGYFLDISVPRSLAAVDTQALASRVRELEDAVYWALGQNGEFPLRQPSQGAYWWRTELRRRSCVPDRIGDIDEVVP